MTDEKTKGIISEAAELAIVVMLIFVMSTFTTKFTFSLPIRIFRFSLHANFRLIDFITPVTALVSALGVYSMVARRGPLPAIEKIVHMIIPFSGTLALGIILRNVHLGAGWLAVLFLGGMLLLLIYSAECVLCDPGDIKYPFGAVLITSAAYAVFLLAVIGIRINFSRLALEAPQVFFLGFVLALRIFVLEAAVKLEGIKALIIGSLTTQFEAAMHYLPFGPLVFGIIVLACFYVLTNVVITLPQHNSIRQSILSQKVSLIILLILTGLLELIFYF